MFEPDMIIFSPDVAQDNLLKYRPITVQTTAYNASMD